MFKVIIVLLLAATLCFAQQHYNNITLTRHIKVLTIDGGKQIYGFKYNFADRAASAGTRYFARLMKRFDYTVSDVNKRTSLLMTARRFYGKTVDLYNSDNEPVEGWQGFEFNSLTKKAFARMVFEYRFHFREAN